ncbi:MAG: ABC transporter ATP-binding protein [Nitrospinales bacterium]
MFLKTIKSFIPYLANYRREIGIGIAALIITDLAGLIIPWLLKQFIDALPNDPTNSLLLKFAGFLFLAASVQAVSRFGWRKYLFGPSRKIEFDILNNLFRKMQSLDKTWYLRQKVGDLMSRGANDLRAVKDFLGLGFLIMIDSFLVIIACVTLMLYIHPRLTMYSLLPLPFLSILFFNFIKTMGDRHQAIQEHLGKITSMVQENLSGIRVLHAFVQEENEKRKFAGLNSEYLNKNMRLAKIFGLFTPSLVFTIGIASMISLWMGGKMVIDGELTLGSFVAFNGYLLMLSWPMMGIGYVFNLTQKGLVAMVRLNEIFDAQPSLLSPRSVLSSEENGGLPIIGGIEFRNLSFAYPGADKNCLNNISLTINPGSCVALVGVVGSGKSTLAQLLPRIFDAQPDSIFIDGVPAIDIPINKLREAIGYVDQEPFLFSMTIRENILVGNPLADKSELDSIIKCVHLMNDLDQLSDGLETIVGERGVSLSGGQKQRVALARALIKKPAILILDDAFSSLDAETESIILNNIREVINVLTTISITHRFSLALEMDKIFVMDQGRVVQEGSHEELVKTDGKYQRMYKTQALAKEMEINLQ